MARPHRRYYVCAYSQAGGHSTFCLYPKRRKQLVFTCVVRDILLDAWYQKKVVFTISKEVLDYIGDVFHVQDMETRLTPLIECACHDPIYIEFEGMENIHGVFCGMTRLTNESRIFEILFRQSLSSPVFCLKKKMLFTLPITMNGLRQRTSFEIRRIPETAKLS